MWGFTWDDLACLFLGFDEEPFLSAKKKPDILFFSAERKLGMNFQPRLQGLLFAIYFEKNIRLPVI